MIFVQKYTWCAKPKTHEEVKDQQSRSITFNALGSRRFESKSSPYSVGSLVVFACLMEKGLKQRNIKQLPITSTEWNETKHTFDFLWLAGSQVPSYQKQLAEVNKKETQLQLWEYNIGDMHTCAWRTASWTADSMSAALSLLLVLELSGGW